MLEIIVSDVIKDQKIRLRNYLKDKFEVLPSSKSIKSAIENGLVLLNGKRGYTGDFVKNQDLIVYKLPNHKPKESPIKLVILYEDHHLAIVVKPAGVLTSGNGKITIAKCIEGLIKLSNETDKILPPKLIHRLDRATIGLLIVVKTRTASKKMRQALDDHQIIKRYAALVEGIDIKPQDIKKPIDEKLSHTKIVSSKNLKTKDATSLINIELLTGRTHQIRKHLAHIGNPIVGDDLYNKGGLTFKKGLFLVAYSITFIHPISKDSVNVEMKLPKKFLKYI